MNRAAARILVFAKSLDQPVKTRLAERVGESIATSVYSRLAARTLAAVGQIDTEATLLVAGDPSHSCIDRWTADVSRVQLAKQAEGDLGARMHDAFNRFASSGGVLLGTDCPQLDAGVIRSAIASLDCADVVLVPVEDGGYVLIGLRTPQPALFNEMPWSTDQVAQLTVSRALRLGLKVRLLPALWDIDDAADYERWLALEID